MVRMTLQETQPARRPSAVGCFDTVPAALLTSKLSRRLPPHHRGPRRLAWPRTSPFHGGNTGSNPVGDAKPYQDQAFASSKVTSSLCDLRPCATNLFACNAHTHQDAVMWVNRGGGWVFAHTATMTCHAPTDSCPGLGSSSRFAARPKGECHQGERRFRSHYAALREQVKIAMAVFHAGWCALQAKEKHSRVGSGT